MKTPLQTTGFFAILFSLLVLIFSAEVKGQTIWQYDFGTGTGTFTSSTADENTFLPAPLVSGGIARVRAGTGTPAGSLELVEVLGENSELLLTPASGTSPTKFSIYDYSPGKVIYNKFSFEITGTDENALLYYLQGDGVTFSNNSNSTVGSFAAIRWRIQAGTSIETTFKDGSDFTSADLTIFEKNTKYDLEIFGNNTLNSKQYIRDGSAYTLAPQTWDLWVDGTLEKAGLPKGDLGVDENIDSFMFYGVSAATGNASIRLFDFEYSRGSDAVIQEFSGQGWRMFSSPVEGATFRNMLKNRIWTQGFPGSDFPDVNKAAPNVYTYSETLQRWQAIAHINNTIPVSHGFIAFVYNASDPNATPIWPKEFFLLGSENNETAIDITHTDVADPLLRGFNLLGNPYGSPINAFDFAVDEADLDDVVYVFDSDTQNYISWNGAGDLTDGIVASYQGFFVRRPAEGTTNTTITRNYKTTGGQLFSMPDSPVIKLQLDNGNIYNNTFFSFFSGEMGTDSRDAFYFFPLISSNSDRTEFLSLFSLNTDEKALNINNLPSELSDIIEIPLHASFNDYDLDLEEFREFPANLRITWPKLQNIPDAWSLELHDLFTGQVVDLLSGTEHLFETTTSLSTPNIIERSGDFLKMGILSNTPETRFQLVINPNSSTSGPVDGEHPQQMRLSQNYPNPFNPTTRINYELPEAGEVTLDVFDIHGRRVATLVNAHQNPGSYTVVFDASRLASGVYVYRLSANGNVVSNRMTLIK